MDYREFLERRVFKHASTGRDVDPSEISPRLFRLWSNPGDIILSPFAGIGSEGYEAIGLGRRFVGCELNPIYFKTATENLRAAEKKQLGLLAL